MIELGALRIQGVFVWAISLPLGANLQGGCILPKTVSCQNLVDGIKSPTVVWALRCGTEGFARVGSQLDCIGQVKPAENDPAATNQTRGAVSLALQMHFVVQHRRLGVAC